MDRRVYRAHLDEGHQETQRVGTQLQAEAGGPKHLLSAAGVCVRAASQAGAAARLPCEARRRCQGLTEQPKQLALRLTNVLLTPC